MKILALVGSPRKGGNTDLLVDQILQGAKAKAQAEVQTEVQSQGHFADKLYLYDHDILPCIDCRGCKRGELVCKLEDGMKEIYPLLEAADIIVFATPIYWYGPTAKMKLLIDRLRPFIANGKLKGKKGIIVAPSEEGPGCCGPLVEMFRMSFEYLGMTMAGSILASAYEKGEIKEKPEELQRAYELGASL